MALFVVPSHLRVNYGVLLPAVEEGVQQFFCTHEFDYRTI